MILQSEFFLLPRSRGFHLITREIMDNLPELPEKGMLHLFLKHTYAGLTMNENADPDVRLDIGTWQGVFLCEFRNSPGKKQIVATIIH